MARKLKRCDRKDKKSWTNYGEAWEACSKQMDKTDDRNLCVYSCSCGRYHIGHTKWSNV